MGTTGGQRSSNASRPRSQVPSSNDILLYISAFHKIFSLIFRRASSLHGNNPPRDFRAVTLRREMSVPGHDHMGVRLQVKTDSSSTGLKAVFVTKVLHGLHSSSQHFSTDVEDICPACEKPLLPGDDIWRPLLCQHLFHFLCYVRVRNP